CAAGGVPGGACGSALLAVPGPALVKGGDRMSTLALKIVAICSMLLDHSLKVLPVQNMLEVWCGVPMETSYWLRDIFEPLGRLAMPIFAFCLAEGCRHT